jgi:serine/threonine protein kinase
MTPERWKQVNGVFCSALEREPGQRVVFLAEACAGDDELRKEVDSLIRYHEQTGSFIDSPAFDVATQKLPEDQRELVEGRVLGHYKILSLLGAGGMGEVYLAQDSKLRRKVALKLLSVSFTKDDERVRRFEQEAHAASALNHPNILTVYDVDQVEGLHFIASEYIAGKTLRQHITEANLSLGEALDVAIQVAGALSAAHEQGIVHRDIKPENIMLRPDGYVKVLDFGLAKLTEKRTTAASTQSPILAAVKTDTGAVMGTAHYMSPEQARGIAVDLRTDIFSLGIVIYEMVTGRVPFEGDTPSHVIVAILEKEPASLESHLPGSPAELQRIVSKALAKDREERYESVKDLLIDLKALRQGLESEAKVESVMAPVTRSRRKPERVSEKKAIPLSRSIWLATLLALVIVGTAWLYFHRKASEPTLPPMRVTPFTTFQGFEFGPSFSPDGRFIAFCWWGKKGDNLDIYIQRIGSSGPPFRLTDDPAADFHPVWSPDGSQIAFARFKSETDKANYIKPALGGPERKIYSSSVKAFWGGDKQMDWSPDGKFLVAPDRLSEGGPYHILLMSPETLERRQLTFAPDTVSGICTPSFLLTVNL